MSAHKGVEGGGVAGKARDRPQNGGRPRLEIDLKMEADHDWSPDTRLQGRAGSLVADM